MRILLQSFETGLYLDTSGGWTNSSDLARNFPNTRQGAEFKIQRRLANAIVVVLPEPAPAANATGTDDEAIRRAQEPTNPTGRRVKAIEANMTEERRLTQRKPATGKQPRGSSRHSCNMTV